MTILDATGKPITINKPRQPQTAKLGYLQQEFSEHPVKRITPAKLVQILEAAERGSLKEQAELFDDMQERDAHLYAEFAKRKLAILGLNWSVEPPKNASAAEKQDATFIEEILTDIDGFADMLLTALDGIGYGYSCTEIEWELNSNIWRPKQFHYRPASWFMLDKDNQDQLRLRDNSPLGQELRQFGWIVHRPKAKTGYIAKAGLFRVLAWAFLFKNYSTHDLAEMLEIYGLPIRLGKYPPGTPDEEKTTLLRAVTGLGHAAAGIIPETMSIEFEQAASGSSEPFAAMMRYCDEAISKAILGSTLTTQAGEKGGGAFALGQVHNEVRHDLRNSDARQLAATLTKDLVYPLLMFNRAGAQLRRAPRLVFDTSESEDITKFASALPQLVNIGMQIPLSWAHEKLGIPVPDKDEVVLQTSTQTTALALNKASLAALSGTTKSVGYEDQVALDKAIDSINDADLDALVEPMLQPVFKAVLTGSSYAAALGLLAEIYPSMAEDELVQNLQQLLFACETWGRLNAKAL